MSPVYLVFHINISHGRFSEVQALNAMIISINSTVEIDIDIEVTKAKNKIIKVKKAERVMFRSRVKWHEEGEKNNPYIDFTPGTPVFTHFTSARWSYTPHGMVVTNYKN